MAKKRNISHSFTTPLLGFTVVLLALLCFLLVLWVLIIAVRMVLG